MILKDDTERREMYQISQGTIIFNFQLLKLLKLIRKKPLNFYRNEKYNDHKK